MKLSTSAILPFLLLCLALLCIELYQENVELFEANQRLTDDLKKHQRTTEQLRKQQPPSAVEQVITVESSAPAKIEAEIPTPAHIEVSDDFQPIDLYGRPGQTFLNAAASLPSIPPTDKVSVHRYEVIYEKYLGPLRGRKGIKLLEIGIGCGMRNGPARGYELFTKYLPNVQYHAIELGSPTCKGTLLSMGGLSVGAAQKRRLAHISKEGIADLLNHTVWGDQGKKETTDKAIELWGPFDVIIDDASHIPALTMASFRNLFHDGLRPGGVYIVEDLQVSTKKNWGGTKEQQLKRETFPLFLADVLQYQHYEYWKVDRDNNMYAADVKAHLDFVEWIRTLECDREICAVMKNKARIVGEKALRPNVLFKEIK